MHGTIPEILWLDLNNINNNIKLNKINMEPITMAIAFAIYGIRAIDAEMRAKKSSKSSASSSKNFTSSRTTISSPKNKKDSEGRICQPEVKLNENDKIKPI